MATLTVGAGQQYSTLVAAVAASHDGDLIQVQAGTYTDDFATVTTKITIQGVGGIAHFVASAGVTPPNGRAILETQTDVTLDHVEFSGAVAPTNNGAGVLHLGGNLSINASYFHNNQDGVLIGPDISPIGTVDIANSEFAFNGITNGLTHNLYISSAADAIITGSYFHDVTLGHEIKSGANSTTIENNVIADGPNSTASYSVDLFNGGINVISNNVIEKGVNASNGTFIHFGGGPSSSSLAVTNNTILSDTTTRLPYLVLNQEPAGVLPTISGNSVYNAFGFSFANGPANVGANTTLTSEPAINAAHPFASSVEIDVTAPAGHNVASAYGVTVNPFAGYQFTVPYDGQVTIALNTSGLGAISYVGADPNIAVTSSQQTLTVTGLASQIAADLAAGLFTYRRTAPSGTDHITATIAGQNAVLDFSAAAAAALSDAIAANLVSPLPDISPSLSAVANTTLEQALAGLFVAGTSPNVVSSTDGSTTAAPVANGFNLLVVNQATSAATPYVPPGYQAAYLLGGAGSSIGDRNGNTLLAGIAGNDTLYGAANDTLIGGEASNTFVAGAGVETIVGGSRANEFFLGTANALVTSQGTDTIIGSSGASTVTATGASLYFGSSGPMMFFANAGAPTLVGGGAETVIGGASAPLVFGGSGALMFVEGSGAGTVVGGAGSPATLVGGAAPLLFFGNGTTAYTPGSAVDTILGFTGSLTATGGANGTLFFGGTAGNNVISTGPASSTIIGGGNGDVLTATGSGSDVIGASGGAETINGAGSTGTNAFFGGQGTDYIVGGSGTNAITAGPGSMTLVGGGALDLFAFDAGATSNTLITDFNTSVDFVKLSGFEAGAAQAALAGAVHSGGSTILTLSDNTQITFQGVGSLTADRFV